MFYLRKQYVYRNESDGDGDAGGGDADTQSADDKAQGEALQAVEAKARKMGWTEKSEFKGDPSKWREAADFVERGENMLPIMKKTVEKQERKIADLEKAIKEFSEYSTKTEQRAYERAVKELKERQYAAVAASDQETFAKLDQEIEDLHKQAAEKPKVTIKTDDAVHPDYPIWLEKNRWVEDDSELAAEAEAQGAYLLARGSKLVGRDFLNEVAKRVKQAYPDKFSNPRRSAAPAVESSAVPAKKGGGKTFADMPKEVQDTCMRLEKQFKIRRENYVKTYFEEQ